MRKIHIFIGTLESGGAQRVCVNLANELYSKGFDVTLVVLNLYNNFFQSELEEQIKIVNLNKANSKVAFFSIMKYVLNEKPMKVLSFHPQISLVLLMIKKLLRLKFRLIGRNITALSIENKLKPSFSLKCAHFLFKMTLKYLDLIIAQSEGMKQDLIRNYNCREDNIVVINNPVNHSIEKAAEKNKNKIFNKKKILFVGRLDKQKGLHYLIDSFSILLEKYPNAILEIVGDGSLKGELFDKINKLNIDHAVQIKGTTKNVIDFYQNCDVVVLSSYYEGFPNVLIEAITMGVPIVSFDSPFGPSEIIEEGVNGYLVEYLNPQELAKSLYNALVKDWDCALIKSTAIKYSSKNIINRYICILDD